MPMSRASEVTPAGEVTRTVHNAFTDAGSRRFNRISAT